MVLAVFFAPDLAADEIALDGPEGRHASVVRRLGVGERVRLTDGRGSYADGRVTTVARSGLTVAVDRRGSVPVPRPRLVVVQALPKGDRAALAVQLLTEVGADRIVPWNADRSQVRVISERAGKTVAKWRAWAFEASKQSRRTWFCEVADLAATADVAELVCRAGVAVVLHEEAKRPLAGIVSPDSGDVLLVVGPEGGLTAQELVAFGVEPYRLGDTVLRTSTAGVAALAILQAHTRWT